MPGARDPRLWGALDILTTLLVGVAVVWWVMAPTWAPTPRTDMCGQDLDAWRDTIVALRLYQAPRWSPWSFARAHPTTPGMLDSFDLDDRQVVTYGVVAVKPNGREGCMVTHTVGLPPTSVLPTLPRPRNPVRWFDVSGRRVRPPLPSGVYFAHGRDTVVVR